MLRLLIESDKSVKVNITLKVADNENKNVHLPVSTIVESLAYTKDCMSFLFPKIDPTKEQWGDIELEVKVKPIEKTSTATSGSAYTPSYSHDWYGSKDYGTMMY